METDETKAVLLVHELRKLDVACTTYWDRGPWCAQVWLTEDHDEFSPSLFVFTEDSAPMMAKPVKWTGTFLFGENQDYDDIHVEFLERRQLGDDEGKVARDVKLTLELLNPNNVPLVVEV